MKRSLCLLLAMVLALSLFAGCGKTETPQTPDAPVQPEVPETPAVPDLPSEPEEPKVLLKWEEPTYEIENTLENRQLAMAAEAKSYYYKGVMNQYGMQDMTMVSEENGGNQRGYIWEYNTAENNTKDQTLYQWCSSFGYDVAYNAFGYKLLDNHALCRTTNLSQGQCGDPEIVVFQYNYTKNREKDHAAAEACVAMMQPGDIITWTRPSDGAGHTLIIVDDMTGDGTLDVLHRSGGAYEDLRNGVDSIEEYGIKLEDGVANLFLNPEKSQYLGGMSRFALHRPALLDAAKYPISKNSQVRLTYPGLRIDRTLSTGLWSSVTSGSVVTMTLEITNYGTEPMTDMPFMEPVPAGCTVVSAPGIREDYEGLVWNVTVPAGETVTISYDLKVEGEPGTVIDFSGASHAGIHSNFLKLTIEAFSPDAEKLRDTALQDAALAASKDSFEFAAKLYEAATGKAVTVPNTEEFQNAYFAQSEYPTIYRNKTTFETELDKMVLNGWFGGQRLITDENLRILEARMTDLQPGDIILVRPKMVDPSLNAAWIFTGDGLLTVADGAIQQLGQEDLTRLFSFQIFALLRPSLVG